MIGKNNLLDQLPKSVITRFAPSPTGYLHHGHILAALYVFGIAKEKGRAFLRIDDHDRQRSKPNYVEAILTDLQWLGFPIEPLVMQSQRFEHYQKVLDDLLANGLAYNCSCTRTQLKAKQPKDCAELFYPGTCRHKKLPNSPDATVRFKLSRHQEEFVDLKLGPVSQNPLEQCGDFVLKDRNGNFSYQFCTAVDDLDDSVNLIIRGEDILSSTGRQIGLMKSITSLYKKDFCKPTYFHHPLLYGSDGIKLSKRFLSDSISQDRLNGQSKEEVLGNILYLAELSKQQQPVNMEKSYQILNLSY